MKRCDFINAAASCAVAISHEGKCGVGRLRHDPCNSDGVEGSDEPKVRGRDTGTHESQRQQTCSNTPRPEWCQHSCTLAHDLRRGVHVAST